MNTQPLNGAKIPVVLKQRRQWVGYQLVPRKGKNTKIPYNPRNPRKKASSIDPKTWGTFDEAAQTYQAYSFDGVGFVFSKDDPFTGVDLDKCRDAKTGELESWAQDIVQQLNSYGEVSPSGTGVHILVEGSLPPKGRKKGKIEMYDDARFFCMTGEHLPGTPTTIEPGQAELDGLHTQVFGKSQMPLPSSNGNHGAIQNLCTNLKDDEVIAKVRQSSKGDTLWSGNFSKYPSQSEADLALCGQLACLANGNSQQIDRLFRQSGLMRPKWDEPHYSNGQTYGEGTIAKVVEGQTFNANTTTNQKSDDVEKAIAEINRTHAVVMVGGKCLILNEERDPVFDHKGVTLSSPADLKLYYANQLVMIEDKPVNPVTLWLKHKDRRQYEGIVMAPEQATPDHYNLWQGFAVAPLAGDCSLYLDHLKWNIARGDDEIYDYIIHWMAHTVQHPGGRVGVSIVLRGKQGTGKGVMCSQFGKLFGSHFVHVQHSKHLVGHFNAHLKGAVVVFGDEAFWAGDKASEGALKAMVTEEQLPIEFKGKDVIYVKNHIHLLMASNHEWVIPAGLEERRFFVLDVGEARMQDHAYFQKIMSQMENGGLEALLHYLLNVDLEGINLRTFPQTQALLENKILTMTPVEKFWYERLQEGKLCDDDPEWVGWVARHRLHQEFVEHAKKTGQNRRSSETELGMGLKKLVPGLGSGNPQKGNKRVAIWEFPDLAMCRRAFDRATNYKHSWPDASAARTFRSEGSGKS